MTALLSLQRRFQDFLLRDDPEPAVADLLGEIAADYGTDPVRRLSIYHDAYRSRLVEALAADYGALHTVLGADAFRAAALRYVTLTPSTHRNLRWYGKGLPEFLRITSPFSGEPWLAELATFEWAISLTFDAMDQPAITFEQLAALAPDAWPGAVFRFHPSLQLLELRSNAPALRQAVDADTPPPAPIDLEQPVQWALWRQDFTVMYRSLSREEAWALDAARAGHAFSRLCEGLCEWLAPDEAAPALAGMLRTWVDSQLIVGLEA